MQTIVCPINLNQPSLVAISFACELAVRTGSRFILLHVFQTGASDPQEALLYVKEARQQLEDLRHQLIEQDALARVVCDYEIRMGVVADEIVAFADAERADLIVMGAHRAEKDPGAPFTSPLAMVLERTECRVMWVPPDYRSHPLKQFVYASDLNGESLSDVSFVLNLARRYEAEVAFLHISQPAAATMPPNEEYDEAEPYSFTAAGHLAVCEYRQENSTSCLNQFCENLQADMLVLVTNKLSFRDQLMDCFLSQPSLHISKRPILFLPRKRVLNTPGPATSFRTAQNRTLSIG